ncbi:MAG: transglutaminase-like domain-containing protein, partial [Gemmataceae bacterium]
QVIARLRQHAVHDRQAVVPPEVPHSVEWFLFESRRGPDYLFASSAALLLRSLGYAVRVVSGFYVRPDRFDVTRGQTPVEKEDAHFWIEVNHYNPNSWFLVEPTPGYELLPAPRSWLQWLAAWQTPLWLLAGFVGLAGLGYLFHRPILDRWAVWTWPGLRHGWRPAVLSTLRLLERRSHWAGQPRPQALVPSRWSGDATLQHLGRLADWAAYAPPQCPPPENEETIMAVCRACLRDWTVARFRQQSIRPDGIPPPPLPTPSLSTPSIPIERTA